MRRRRLALLFGTLVASGVAHADDKPAANLDADTEIARRHFQRGTEFYQAQRYTEAIEEFEAARRVKPLAAFDFNIGRAHDRLEHTEASIAAYERYLRAAPTSSDGPELRVRIETLRRRLKESQRPTSYTAAPVVPASVIPDAATHAPAGSLVPRRRVATWVVGATGLALLGGSLAAGLVANARYGDLKNSCSADGTCDAASGAQTLIDSGRAAGLASDLLLGVGLAAVAIGVVLFFVEGRHPAEHHAFGLVPSVGEHAVGLTLEVTP